MPRAEDTRAELVRRLLEEYEQMKLAAQQLGNLPPPLQGGRSSRHQVTIEQTWRHAFPDVQLSDLQDAWRDILKRAKLVQHHRITREELSVREYGHGARALQWRASSVRGYVPASRKAAP